MNKHNKFNKILLSGWLFLVITSSCGTSTKTVTTLDETPTAQSLYTNPSPVVTRTTTSNVDVVGAGNGEFGWISSSVLPLDEIERRKIDLNMNVISIAYGDARWIATLQSLPEITQEVAAISSKNLKDELIKNITNGKYVSRIAWGDDIWLIVYSNIIGVNSQKVAIVPDVSLEDFSVDRNEGYFVTDAAFDGNQWVVILSKTDEITDQKIEYVKDLGVEKYISSDDQYLLTTIVSGGEKIFLVKSVYASYSHQEILISDEFQKDYITFAWFDGYKNFNIFYLNGNWVHTIWK